MFEEGTEGTKKSGRGKIGGVAEVSSLYCCEVHYKTFAFPSEVESYWEFLVE